MLERVYKSVYKKSGGTMRKVISLTYFFAVFSLLGIGKSLPFGFNYTVYYSFTGNNSIDVSEYRRKYKKTMDYAEQARVGWWRAMSKFEWGSVQPDGPNSWDWNNEDSLVKWAGEREIHILAVLGCHRITPEWAANKNISDYDFARCYPPDSAHWSDYHLFVKKLVERYDGDGIDDMPGLLTPIKYWEFTNEPYNKYFWGTPEQFIDMFKRTREAIKEADPEAKIVGPCLTSCKTQPFKWLYYNTEKDKVDTTYFTDWIDMEKYILTKIGIKNLDIISHHLYQNSTNFVNYVNELRELIQYNFGMDKPIWITEYGSQNSDIFEVDYKKSDDKATCIYSAPIGKPFYGEVTAQYDHTEEKVIDTFLYVGDTVRLFDRDTDQWDTLENFQGGTITHKNGKIALQEGDSVKIFHIWLENINHSYNTQQKAYQKLLDKFDKKFLRNFKIFFFCVDNWVHRRYYPTTILFGRDKSIKLYRVKNKDAYTIIDPEGGPQDAYHVLKDYIEANFQ